MFSWPFLHFPILQCFRQLYSFCTNILNFPLQEIKQLVAYDDHHSALILIITSITVSPRFKAIPHSKVYTVNIAFILSNNCWTFSLSNTYLFILIIFISIHFGMRIIIWNITLIAKHNIKHKNCENEYELS